MLHILHNAIGDILASMADSPKFLKQLRTICNYFKHSQLRQYYQETCLVGDHARYSAMFKSWPAVYIEWRWGSLVECLKHMDGALCAVLRLTWDVSSMKKNFFQGEGRPELQVRPGLGSSRRPQSDRRCHPLYQVLGICWNAASRFGGGRDNQ